jgi:hypothetical protein
MINLKKVLLKIRYLQEEHNDCLDLYNKAKYELESIIRQTHSDLNVFDKDIDRKFLKSGIEDITSTAECESQSIDSQQWAKKLFRKIAMITHPDKIPDELSQSVKDKFLILYQKSNILIDECDYVGLVMIADELNIDLAQLSVHDWKIFKEKQIEIEKKIIKLKQSIYWVWLHSSDDKKNNIIKEFINQRG